MVAVADYFDLEDSVVKSIFAGSDAPWDPLKRIPGLLAEMVGSESRILAQIPDGARIGNGPVYIDETVRIEPGASTTRAASTRCRSA